MTKMADNFDSILELCLSQIAAGKATIWNCLARFPEHATELEPLLVAAEEMWAVPKPMLSPEARGRIEARVLGSLDTGTRPGWAPRRRPERKAVRRWAAVALAATLAVVFLAVVFVDTVQETLPGSPLHSVRLAAEESRLWLAPQSQEPRLHLEFARRRLDEVEALTAKGAVDPAVVDAMTEQTEAALAGVEELPPTMAVALVDDLMVLIGDQQETLSSLVIAAPTPSQDEVVIALETSHEQKGRAQVLVSSLPMPPALAVTETAAPMRVPEPGGVVEFTVSVKNEGSEAITLSSITNSIHGESNGPDSCFISSEGQRLGPGESYQCTFSAFVFRNAGESEADTVEVVASDDDGNIARASTSATVRVVDKLPVATVVKEATPRGVSEPGADAKFTVRVTNTGGEKATLIALVDDIHGNLNGRGDCFIPVEGISLAPGDSHSCAFKEVVLGNAGDTEIGTATAVIADDEGNRVKASGSATVTITDVRPQIWLLNSANPSSVPEPGGAVQFAVRIANGSVEAVRITSLVDDVHGDLDGQGTCSIPAGGIQLGIGEWYECAFEAEAAGNAGDSETATATALAFDDEGNRVTAAGSSIVKVTDVLPTVLVSKMPTPSIILEPGAEVKYTVQVANYGGEDVTLMTLVDDTQGALTSQGSCSVPAAGIVLGPNEAYRCAFSSDVTGNAGDSIVSSTTAVVVDDEANRVATAGSASVSVNDVLPEINVSKLAVPGVVPEPGAEVEYRVQVTSNSVEDVALVSIVDDAHGNVDGLGTCALPTGGLWLRPGQTYRCAYSVEVTGNAGDSETDSVAAVAIDDEANRMKAADHATVFIADVLPSVAVLAAAAPASMPEPGGAVDYVVQVTNDSVEDVTILSLLDDVYGDLDGHGTCSLPLGGLILSPGGSQECTFEAQVEGNAHDVELDIVTVRAADDEGNSTQVSATAAVTITDVLPVIEVSKTASADSVSEPGGPVEFQVQVSNSGVEDVTLISLVDDAGGNLDGQGTCSVPTPGLTLEPGTSYSCSFNADVGGNAGDIAAHKVTAEVSDDEGNRASAADSTEVHVTDLLPSIHVSLVSNQTSVPEPGGPVEFQVAVTNGSAEDVVITSLVDGLLGSLHGLGSCTMPLEGITLGPGGVYQCAFRADVVGSPGDTIVERVTATGSDDEGSLAEASDDVEVLITDILPNISVSRTADPSTVLEPGGAVQFTVQISNDGAEDVALISLVDDVYGDLRARGSCSVPPEGIWVAPGAAYGCSFGADVFGNAGDAKIDTVTVLAADNEGNRVSVSASATVIMADAKPVIAVSTAVHPSTVPEPGGMVEYEVNVTNHSAEAVLVVNLFDDVYGNLGGQGTCVDVAQGIGLSPGETYQCAFGVGVYGVVGDSTTNTVAAVAIDDEGNRVEAASSTTVAITAVSSSGSASTTGGYLNTAGAVGSTAGGYFKAAQ